MEKNIEDLKHIRSMMERSSKFLSLSGISGISAGIFALTGAAIACLILYKGYTFTGNLLFDLLLTATAVFVAASASGLYFSLKKARKEKAKFWMPATRQILIDFFVPLVIGGLFSLILIYQCATHLVASAMLIFYGLALINAGARTYRDIKILGASEIILGITAGIFVYEYTGLLFWTIGFGWMNIMYGAIMYFKYEHPK
jgi:hypothetical protein